MQGMWLASYVVLWVVVLGLGVGLVAVGRHIGSVLERVSRLPLGGRPSAGPSVGSRLWDDTSSPLQNDLPASVSEGSKLYIAVFVSTTCPHCQHLIPALGALSGYSGVQPLVFSQDEIGEDDPYTGSLGELGIPYLHGGRELFERNQITAVPTSALVDRSGLVLARKLGDSISAIEEMIAEFKAA
ncbi:MAG TPA: hypothetical protein VK464_13920 [Symbiobacteriaceae bacterium]|jgi:hypothetical protein|nr:hypothetical protein [Symbiobacteriaceae bacterium]